MTVYINLIWMRAEDYGEVLLLAACFTSGLGQLFGKFVPDFMALIVIFFPSSSLFLFHIIGTCSQVTMLRQCEAVFRRLYGTRFTGKYWKYLKFKILL